MRLNASVKVSSILMKPFSNEQFFNCLTSFKRKYNDLFNGVVSKMVSQILHVIDILLFSTSFVLEKSVIVAEIKLCFHLMSKRKYSNQYHRRYTSLAYS